MPRKGYDHLITRCEKLSIGNLSKYEWYIKQQEILRLQLVGTNNDYKCFKKWLDTAYEEILTSKSKHGNLTQLYYELLGHNIVEKFLDYANNQEVLQLKFIDTVNEYKDLKIDLDTVHENIASLKSESNNSAQNTEELLENTSNKKSVRPGKRQEFLRQKFTEAVNKCERLKVRLDAAYEAIAVLSSEHDESTRRFRILFENNLVKEFLDCAKYQEKLQLKFTEKCNECEYSNFGSNQSDADIKSLNLQLAEILQNLNAERLLLEQIEKERDSFDYLSDRLCSLMFKSRRLTLSEDIEKQCLIANEKFQKSMNVDIVTELDSNYSSEISISESKVDLKQSNGQIPSENEYVIESFIGWKEQENVNIEIQKDAFQSELDLFSDEDYYLAIIMKYKKANAVPYSLQSFANKSVEYMNRCFDNDPSVFISSDATILSSNVSLKGDMLAELEMSTSTSNQRKLRNCTVPKTPQINVLKNPLESFSFLCDKCGKSFMTRNAEQMTQECPACLEHSYCDNDNEDEDVPTNDTMSKGKSAKIDERDSPKKQEETKVKKKRFRCNECDKVFKRKDALEMHESKFHGSDLHRYDCAYCNKRLHRKDHLVYHIFSVHLPEHKPYKCSSCSKSFVLKHVLEKHMSEKHDPLKKSGVRCHICDRNYSGESNLNKHIQSVHKKMRPYACPKCDKAFFDRQKLMDHSLVHTSQKSFQCSSCDRRFKHDRARALHEKTVHKGYTGRYCCEHCNKRYHSKTYLSIHIHSHHFGGVNKPFKCTKCDKSFITKSKLDEHQSAHSSRKPYKCSYCEQCFNRIGNKKRHERTVHERELRYFCAHCEKRFNEKSSLSIHIHMRHFSGLSKPFKCTTCNKSFAFKYTLKMHESSVHTSARPYKCSMCDQCFKSPQNRRSHERTSLKHNSGLKPSFECTICEKSFSLKNTLRNHQRSHLEKLFKCSLCDKYFKTSDSRRAHERGVHVEDSRFDCLHCDKVYRYKGDLKRHEQAYHSMKGNKQFKCTICNKSFALRSYLKLHEVVHVSERLYKCSMCDMRFKGPQGKRIHERGVHENHADGVRFNCAHCDKVYRHKGDLKRHIQAHHSMKRNKKFTCTICNKSFLLKSYLKRHEAVHASEKLFKCSNCEMRFKDPRGRHMHERRIHALHADDVRFNCAHCDGVYNRKLDLAKHLQTNHA